ncbi:extracellular solute-binding protein [Paenibacillus sp. J2TS4]|uniref:extracellular solute-binding protein n=1 Tax=Paenibacillus sp. J2TS4 TaxID=2807194 RepID=UPI001B00E50A|nr:extracellular solute-binding protein [Paenibacillus sp. J2TS4]GIP34671.1 sugar ABC transporter permease [Paenibacillus sp. J2TS4]
MKPVKSLAWGRLISMFMALIIVFGMAACSADSGKKPESGGDSPQSPESPSSQGKTKLSLFIVSRSPDALYDNNMLVWKELGEKFNVEFDFITGDNATMTEKFRFTMSSGDYPDIIAGQVEDINKFGQDGAFIKLNDLIEQKAPNIKKYLLDDKDAYMQTSDGEGDLYAVPMQSAIRTSWGPMIRTDWLERVGLDMPETIEDWYNVLKAFKEQDANGNGDPNDEIPFSTEAHGDYYMGFLDAWGLDMDRRWTFENDRLIYTPTDPRFKQFLETMHQWYQEGLLDKELMSKQKVDLDADLLNNKVGATYHWIGHIAGFNSRPEVQEIDGFKYQVVPPPVLNKGDKPLTHKQQQKVVMLGWGISSQNEHVDLTMQIFDYIYSEEGQMLWNFGKEGDTYVLDEQGQPKYTEKITSSPDGIYKALLRFGGQAWVGFRQDPRYEKEMVNDPDVFEQMNSYIENDYFRDPFPTLKYPDNDFKRFTELKGQIDTYVEEMTAKFVIGREPLSKFDAFVQQVEKMGLKEMQEIQDRAYERYKEMIK